MYVISTASVTCLAHLFPALVCRSVDHLIKALARSIINSHSVCTAVHLVVSHFDVYHLVVVLSLYPPMALLYHWNFCNWVQACSTADKRSCTLHLGLALWMTCICTELPFCCVVQLLLHDISDHMCLHVLLSDVVGG